MPVWLGDDRYVPHDDERSNVRLLRETVLDHLTGPAALSSCAKRAWTWRRQPRRFDALLRAEGLPHLQLLGLGPDGHTASLFPDAPSLDEAERLAVAAPAGMEPFVDRVTMTIPALAGAGARDLPRDGRGQGRNGTGPRSRPSRRKRSRRASSARPPGQRR